MRASLKLLAGVFTDQPGRRTRKTMHTPTIVFASTCVVALLCAAHPAQAIGIYPFSSGACSTNPTGFTCDIAETNADGLPAEISDILTLPDFVIAGYVVLMDSGDASNSTDQGNQALWGDVLQFLPTTVLGVVVEPVAYSLTARLFSDGCDSGDVTEGDRSCFPSVATVLGLPHAFVLEDPTGVTSFSATIDGVGSIPAFDPTYTIHSDAAEVPEPASLTLLGSGLAGLAIWARRRRT